MKRHLSCVIFLMLIKSSFAINIWSDWSVWSECTPQCQSGTKSRTRTCVSAPCLGDSMETSACSSLCGCQKIPCNNGGTCIQNVTDPKIYECACVTGFYGNNSQNCDYQIESPPSKTIGSIIQISSPLYDGQYPKLMDLFWVLQSSTATTFYLAFASFDVSSSTPSDCPAEYASNTQTLKSNGVGTTILTASEITKACPCVYDLLIINKGNDTSITDTSKIFCNANTQGQTTPSTINFPDTDTITIKFISDQNTYGSSAGFEITISIGICTVNPCENGGTCTESGGAYTCQCPPNFNGNNCQTNSSTTSPIAGCGATPCLNGGTCQADGTCLCMDGWSGATCADKQTGNQLLTILLPIFFVLVLVIIVIVVILLCFKKYNKRGGKMDMKTKYQGKNQGKVNSQEDVTILSKGSPT